MASFRPFRPIEDKIVIEKLAVITFDGLSKILEEKLGVSDFGTEKFNHTSHGWNSW